MTELSSALPMRRARFEVVVIGGGAAGVAAAVSASRLGKKTALIERCGFLGGAATASQVLAYCGFFTMAEKPVQAVGGIGAEVLRAMEGLGASVQPIRMPSGAWIVRLDAETVKLALDRLVLQSGVELQLHTQMAGVRRTGRRINAVVVSDFEGLMEIEAEQFVDASGHASLARQAGVLLRDDAANLQPASLAVRLGGIAAGASVDRTRLTELVKHYNLNAETPMTRTDGGVLMQLPLTGDFWWTAVDMPMHSVAGRDMGAVETQARERVWKYLPVLRKLPGFEGATLISSGPQIGIRESPRVRSRADVSEQDAINGRRDSTGIGRAAWPMEQHEGPGRVNWRALGGEAFFDIPWDALRAPGIDNLWFAGRVVGADAAAYASIRVMGTSFATGHAAGVSAALGSSAVLVVRSELARQGAIV